MSALAAWGRAAALLLCLLAAPALRAATPSAAPEKTVVLVHGAFADGSCWVDVIRLLQAAGVKVVAVQNPLASLAGDVAAVQRVVNQQTTPVVLVAHSWGGMVATEAGVNPKVESLVYVAAFAPEVGQSIASMLAAYPPAPWAGELQADEAGFLTMPMATFLRDFAPDLPLRQAQALQAVQGPTFQATLGEAVTQAAWQSKPARYLVAEDDRIIPPDLQRQMAARMGARTTRLAAGHLLMLSHPAVVAQAILAAVRGR